MTKLQIGKQYKAKNVRSLWTIDYIGLHFASMHNDRGSIQVVDHAGEPAMGCVVALIVEPEPSYRPWTESEVPVGAILRYKSNVQSVRLLIQRSSEKGMVGPDTQMGYKFLLENMEHSLTGVNGPWLPCGVLIS